MYQPQIVQDAFMGLCGFRQTDDPSFSRLSDVLLKTPSNLLIEHSLINIENIEMTARNYAMITFAPYVAGTTYADNARVRYTDNKVYESLQAGNIGNTPSSSPDYWVEVNLLSLYLEDVMRSSIDQVIERVFDEKKLRSETKTLIQSIRAMDASGEMSDLVLNQGNLVGLEVTLNHRNNLVAVIEQIGLQLSQAQDDLPVYIYHSSQMNGPIATLTLDQTKVVAFQWHRPAVLPTFHHLTADYNAGGAFYIMIDQNDLVGQCIRSRYDFGVAPCTCNPYAYSNYNKLTEYVSIRSVYVPRDLRPVDGSDVPDPTQMFNIRDLRATTDNNFGFNIDVTVMCDLTEFLVRQRAVFAGAVRDMVIVKLLDQMKNSTRQNGIDEKTKQLANFALQARHLGGGGLIDDLNRKLKVVDFEVSNLDRTCMPKKNNTRNGPRVSSFGLYH